MIIIKCIERYEEYHDIDFDRLIRKIRSGEIVTGRYSDLVKTKSIKNKKEILYGSSETENINEW